MRLIDYSLKEIKESLFGIEVPDSKLIDELEKIKDGFTLKREKIGEYVKNSYSSSCYALFYGLTNYPKLEKLLSYLPCEIKDYILDSTFYDIGTGSGSFSFAYWDLSLKKSPVYAIDSSPAMLDIAHKLKNSFYSGASILFQKSIGPNDISKENKKTLFFGNSINENSANWAFNWVEKISPDVVLFIEPGTKDAFFKCIEFRELLIQKEYRIIYPCLNSLNCPIKENELDDWCHQIFKLHHSVEVEALCQKMRADRIYMPVTAHVYVKKSVFLDFKDMHDGERVFRVLPENKFSYNFTVCSKEDLSLRLSTIKILKKKLSSEEKSVVKKIEQGALINLDTYNEK